MKNNKPVFFLDTCVLIDLTSSIFTEEKEIIEQLIDYIKKDRLEVVIPDQVETEWSKNKSTINKKKSFKSTLRMYKNVAKAFKKEDSDIVVPIIDEYLNDTNGEQERILNTNISLVDQLIIISKKASLSKDYYEKIIDLGLQKKAPFRKKNSVGDAVIFFTAIEYINENNINGQKVFVSSNSSDFCGNNDNRYFHDDLKTEADKVDLKFFNNIGNALNEFIDDGAVTQDCIDEIDRRLTQRCYNCGYSFTGSENGQWLRGPQGITYCYECPICKSLFDTGDSVCD